MFACLLRAFATGFCATLGVLSFAALAAQLPLPGTNGPSLGDFTTNLYTLTQAYTQLARVGNHSSLSVSQTAGQANCTQLDANALQQIATSASTGYVCLPTAVSGKLVVVYNGTGQSVSIYSSASSFTSGTADTINGTAGSTAYTGMTTLKTAICAAVANGTWACGSIS